MTGVTVSVTLQISVMHDMLKMGTASYIPLQTVDFNCIEGRAFRLPFVIYFLHVTGFTVSVTLQISVMHDMFKMGTASYIPLQTVDLALTHIVFLKRSRT